MSIILIYIIEYVCNYELDYSVNFPQKIRIAQVLFFFKSSGVKKLTIVAYLVGLYQIWPVYDYQPSGWRLVEEDEIYYYYCGCNLLELI